MSTALTRPEAGAGAPRSWLGELARAGAIPAAAAVVLTGLLTVWVLTGGAGTIHRVQVQVSQAAVPMRGYTTATSAAVHSAGTYLTIRNLTGRADQLSAVSSPVARRVELTERQTVGGKQTVVRELTVPAHGTLTLTPFGDDAILVSPAAYENQGTVALVLTFRHAGRIAVNAAVSAPGTP